MILIASNFSGKFKMILEQKLVVKLQNSLGTSRFKSLIQNKMSKSIPT